MLQTIYCETSLCMDSFIVVPVSRYVKVWAQMLSFTEMFPLEFRGLGTGALK